MLRKQSETEGVETGSGRSLLVPDPALLGSAAGRALRVAAAVACGHGTPLALARSPPDR